MKKICILSLVFLLVTSPVFAFLNEVEILPADKITKLTDDELLNKYIEVKIEAEASREFHGQAGFTPKEYERFKAMLRYIVNIRQEMSKRKMEAPPVDEWLR